MSFRSDLQSKIQPIVDAAIVAEMSYYGFDGSLEDGFTGYSRATEANPLSEEVTVAPPGAANEGEATDWNGQVYTYGHNFFAMTFRPKEDVYDKWREMIPSLFEPWLEIPEADDLEPKVQAVREAAKKLGLSVGTDGEGTDMQLVSGNTKLSGDVDYLSSKIGNYDGETIRAFHRAYVSRMPTVISGQWSAACILGVGLAAEQAVWRRTGKDVLELADRMKEAMEDAQGGGGGDAGTWIKILGAFASAATIFVSGPAAPLVGGIATGLGILGSFVPEGEQADHHEGIGADWPDGVYDNCVKVLDKVKSDIQTEELAARDCLSNARFEVLGNAGDFDLSNPSKLLGETDVGDLTTADDTIVELDVLDEIGGTVMPAIAAELTSAVGLLDAASGESAWMRPSDIGLSAQGHYWEWSQLYELLTKIIADTAWELVEGGEHLQIAAGIIGESDEQARKDLATIQGELEAHAAETAGGSPVSQSSTASGTPLR
jgi:hypothetical protein